MHDQSSLSSYSYSNGNVTNDPSRGIGSIRYNILNLPDLVEFQDGSEIEIVYDGEGNVWRKTLTSTTDTLPNGLYQMVIDYVDEGRRRA